MAVLLSVNIRGRSLLVYAQRAAVRRYQELPHYLLTLSLALSLLAVARITWLLAWLARSARPRRACAMLALM